MHYSRLRSWRLSHLQAILPLPIYESQQRYTSQNRSVQGSETHRCERQRKILGDSQYDQYAHAHRRAREAKKQARVNVEIGSVVARVTRRAETWSWRSQIHSADEQCRQAKKRYWRITVCILIRSFCRINAGAPRSWRQTTSSLDIQAKPCPESQKRGQ